MTETTIDEKVTLSDDKMQELIVQSFGKAYRVVPFAFCGTNISRWFGKEFPAAYFGHNLERLFFYPKFHKRALEFARLYEQETGQEIEIVTSPHYANIR